MGATLRYAKVVDRDHLQAHGGLRPAIDNLVTLADYAPAVARDFLVMRAWDDVDSGGFEETWRIEDAHGHAVYRGTPRTVLAQDDDIFDEVQGVRFEHTDSHQLVLEVDGREVARTDFAVVVTADGGAATDVTVTTSDDATAGGPTDDPHEPADLSDQDRAVLTAVADVEAREGPGHVHDVARAAALDIDTVRSSLGRLLGPYDLVQELGPAGQEVDQGPRYRVKARP